jgi:predicted ATP-binding protein involved in virulence
MRIDRLTLQNFRGFSSLELDLHPRCTVLAGVNGSGKSSVLDALAVAVGSWFLGFNDGSPRSILPAEIRRERFDHKGHVDLEPRFPVRVEARGQVSSGSTLTWARELRSAEGKTTYGEAGALRAAAEAVQEAVQRGEGVDLPVLAYYGTGRLWVQKRASQVKELGLSSRTLGYQDCLDPESNHKLFEAWMKLHTQALVQRLSGTLPESSRAEAGDEDVHLEAVARTAARCVEGGRRFYFDLRNDELRLHFEDDSVQSFALLSDGYRNLVALAADVAWRAVRLNPHRGDEAPAEATGVVLIDEVELHLHPAWQRTVLKRLQDAFPRLQFVVTTHSPQVLASVEAECVRFLDAAGKVHRVAVAEGLDTNTVLRDLMGVPERPPEFAQRLATVASLIEEHHLGEARSQLDELALALGQDDPSITALEWELADARSFASEES